MPHLPRALDYQGAGHSGSYGEDVRQDLRAGHAWGERLGYAHQLEQSERTSSAREKALAATEQTLHAARTELGTLCGRLGKRDADLTTLRKSAVLREEEIALLRGAISDKHERIFQLDAQVSRLDALASARQGQIERLPPAAPHRSEPIITTAPGPGRCSPPSTTPQLRDH